MEEIKNKQKHNIHMLEEIDVEKRKNKRLPQRKLKDYKIHNGRWIL